MRAYIRSTGIERLKALPAFAPSPSIGSRRGGIAKPRRMSQISSQKKNSAMRVTLVGEEFTGFGYTVEAAKVADQGSEGQLT